MVVRRPLRFLGGTRLAKYGKSEEKMSALCLTLATPPRNSLSLNSNCRD